MNLLKAVRTLLYGADKADFPPQTAIEFKAVYDGDRKAKPIAMTARGLVDEEGNLLLYAKDGVLVGKLAEAEGTTFGRSLLTLADAAALRVKLGLPAVVTVTESTTLTAAHHGVTITNNGATDSVFLTPNAQAGTELLIVNEAGKPLTLAGPLDVSYLVNGGTWSTNLDSFAVGDCIRLKRTNQYWVVLENKGFEAGV